MVVFTDWLFASSCSPPRLSATQLLSATKGQLPLRSGSLKSISTMYIDGPKGETDFTISSLLICSLTIFWKLSGTASGPPGN